MHKVSKPLFIFFSFLFCRSSYEPPLRKLRWGDARGAGGAAEPCSIPSFWQRCGEGRPQDLPWQQTLAAPAPCRVLGALPVQRSEAGVPRPRLARARSCPAHGPGAEQRGASLSPAGQEGRESEKGVRGQKPALCSPHAALQLLAPCN